MSLPSMSPRRNLNDTISTWQTELGFESQDDFLNWRTKILSPLCLEWVIWSTFLRKHSKSEKPHLPLWEVFSEKLFAEFQKYKDEPANYYELENIDFACRTAIKLCEHIGCGNGVDRDDGLCSAAGCVQPRFNFSKSPDTIEVRYYKTWQLMKFVNKEMTGAGRSRRSLHPEKYPQAAFRQFMRRESKTERCSPTATLHVRR